MRACNGECLVGRAGPVIWRRGPAPPAPRGALSRGDPAIGAGLRGAQGWAQG